MSLQRTHGGTEISRSEGARERGRAASGPPTGAIDELPLDQPLPRNGVASDRQTLWVTIAITAVLTAIIFWMIWTGHDAVGHRIATTLVVTLVGAVKIGGYAYAATRPPIDGESLEEDQR